MRLGVDGGVLVQDFGLRPFYPFGSIGIGISIHPLQVCTAGFGLYGQSLTALDVSEVDSDGFDDAIGLRFRLNRHGCAAQLLP